MTGPGIAHHSLWPRTVYRTCLDSSDLAENGYRGNSRAPPEGGGKFDSVAIYHFTAKAIRRGHGRGGAAVGGEGRGRTLSRRRHRAATEAASYDLGGDVVNRHRIKFFAAFRRRAVVFA